MKRAAKRIVLLCWLAIAAFQLLFSSQIASAKPALVPENRTWEIFSLAAKSRQANRGQVAEAQRERAPPQRSTAPGCVLAPETTASVPDNVFAYNPAPKGVVIQQDGPLVTSNQASGVITDTARMLSAPNNVTNQLPGLVIGQFDMVTDPGPLASFPSNPAANFASGKYTAITLTEDVVLYRGGSSAGSPLGQWFTAEPPSSVAQVRIDSAVKPQWIDPVTGQLTGSSPVDTLYSVRVPAGSTIYQGPVGYQGGVYLGGSGPTQTQIFIPRTTPGLQPVNAAPLH